MYSFRAGLSPALALLGAGYRFRQTLAFERKVGLAQLRAHKLGGRRFLRSTGLTYGTVRQIERAERAAGLLESGSAILDVADDLGFSDQAHLTRALKRYLGRTPGRILTGKA